MLCTAVRPPSRLNATRLVHESNKQVHVPKVYHFSLTGSFKFALYRFFKKRHERSIDDLVRCGGRKLRALGASFA